jgi:hypothetical protein
VSDTGEQHRIKRWHFSPRLGGASTSEIIAAGISHNSLIWHEKQITEFTINFQNIDHMALGRH